MTRPTIRNTLPDRACWHDQTRTGVAIHTSGPSRDQQIAQFDRDHPDGENGHRRVKKLPKAKGDPK
jgi:hypothetical protein